MSVVLIQDGFGFWMNDVVSPHLLILEVHPIIQLCHRSRMTLIKRFSHDIHWDYVSNSVMRRLNFLELSAFLNGFFFDDVDLGGILYFFCFFKVFLSLRLMMFAEAVHTCIVRLWTHLAETWIIHPTCLSTIIHGQFVRTNSCVRLFISVFNLVSLRLQIFQVDFFNYSDLTLIRLVIQFEHQCLLLMVSMIDNLVLLKVLVGGMRSANINPCELLVDFNVFPARLHDVVNVQDEQDFAFGWSWFEELVACHLCTVAKQITQQQAHTLVKRFVRQKLDVFLGINSFWHACLNALCEHIACSEH